MNLAGSQAIAFDNRNGPVNIWFGPPGSPNVAKFRGGSAAVSIASNPLNAPHIYVASKGGIDLGGNIGMQALVYAVNTDASGNHYGTITNSGNPVIDGQIIGNNVNLNGGIVVNYITDLVQPVTFGYYGYDNLWE